MLSNSTAAELASIYDAHQAHLDAVRRQRWGHRASWAQHALWCVA